MSLLSSVIGFGAFGFGARCFQLGIQKQGIFERPLGHLVSTAAFGAIGYGLYFVEQRQLELLAVKKKDLQAIRDREQAAYEAKKAGSS